MRLTEITTVEEGVKDWLGNQIMENTNYAHEHGIDKPEFTNWKWAY